VRWNKASSIADSNAVQLMQIMLGLPLVQLLIELFLEMQQC
jgi:hypothetical protein